MTRRPRSDAPLTEADDFLAALETVPHAATAQEQIAIEQATQTAHGPNEGNHYNRPTNQVADLRNRIHDHLAN